MFFFFSTSPYGTRKLITLSNFIRFINLHDVTKCNKSEDISRNCGFIIRERTGVCLHLVFLHGNFPSGGEKKTTPSVVIYNAVTQHQWLRSEFKHRTACVMDGTHVCTQSVMNMWPNKSRSGHFGPT